MKRWVVSRINNFQMIERLTIRPEKEQDIARINQIITSAFEEISLSNQKEHLLVSDLRDTNLLTLSLVTERGTEILGHIAFSEVTINDEYMFWHVLAPVSVDPEYQNQGIGSTLIETGLDNLQKFGANGA